jgi:hypothetical protein
MQYLDLPTTLEDMVVSLSMTGVTILTKTRFKKRHQGMKDIVQIPRSGFVPNPRQAAACKRPILKKGLTPKTENGGVPNQISKITIPRYKIDKREVSHRIRNYLNQMRGEKMLYFWTITFPVTTDDDSAYILLNKWLTRLRQEKMLREYLWIAERQQNGTIHFHMVINQKMCVKKANKFMRASIMHSINKGEIKYSRLDAMRYNGVDIAKDRKTRRVTNFAKKNKEKSLSNYLTKYVTKNDGMFLHLAWHSSRGYSNLITAVRFTMKEYSKGNTENLLNDKEIITHEFYTFRRWKASPPKDLLMYLGLLNSDIQKKFN